MTFKTFFYTLVLLILSQNVYAAKNTDFLLKADDTTSFMNFEFHSLAIEAASNKNYEDAFRLYEKIAQKDDNKAEYNIGMMYMKGLGTKKSKMDAYKWLRRASRHGNKEATLFFQEMNERHEQSRLGKQAIKEVTKAEPTTSIEKNTSEISLDAVLKPHKVNVSSQSIEKKEGFPLLYIIVIFIVLLLSIALFFVIKSSKKASKETSPQGGLKYKSQMYDITHEHISKYHNELLAFFDIEKYKNDKEKMQMYYMFIGGMIDYFCQLEDFSDAEERRIFTTHMGKVEGKENVTAITQSILEGQRKTSLYHAQAAGGVSAKEWQETGSNQAFLMLKKVLTKKND